MPQSFKTGAEITTSIDSAMTGRAAGLGHDALAWPA